MICPMCGNQESRVLETRKTEGREEVLRRHICKKKSCSYRFKTFEGYEAADPEAQFKVVEARKILKKVEGWLEQVAKRIPIVRDSLRQIRKAQACLNDELEVAPEDEEEELDAASSN